MKKGIGASEGIGIGYILKLEEPILNIPNSPVENAHDEFIRFQNTVNIFIEKTLAMANILKMQTGEKEAEILEGHVAIIQDPSIIDGVKEKIEEGLCAEQALSNVCQTFIDIFSATKDPLTMERITDIEDVKTRMLKLLMGIEEVSLAALPQNTILVAKDFTPSMTVGLSKEHVIGILTELGGYTSHSAILARSLGIPAVLNIKDLLQETKNGQEAILDGESGIVFLSPDAATKAQYQQEQQTFLENKKSLQTYKGKPTCTKDGVTVDLLCNIGSLKDAKDALDCDGEGIGLFRTEFLFMERNSLPTEEEQFEAYKEVAKIFGNKPITIRTLDIGGDKEIPYLNLEKEENPFLGYRAIRICLSQTDLFRTQLRSILRASAYGNIQILLPFITSLEELRAAKEIIEETKRELSEKNIPFKKDIPIGVMIETPAATLISDLFAKESDFFSIGTNDLIQYTIAVDRGNTQISNLYTPYHPAVLRAISHIITCAKKEGIPVCMCGEAAADPQLIPLLLSYGLDKFSVGPNSVLNTRKIIAKWDKKNADSLATQVSALTTTDEIKKLLTLY